MQPWRGVRENLPKSTGWNMETDHMTLLSTALIPKVSRATRRMWKVSQISRIIKGLPSRSVRGRDDTILGSASGYGVGKTYRRMCCATCDSVPFTSFARTCHISIHRYSLCNTNPRPHRLLRIVIFTGALPHQTSRLKFLSRKQSG